MVKYDFGRRSHDFIYFEVGFFFKKKNLPWIQFLLEGIITKICRKPSIQCNLIIFQTNFRPSLVQYRVLAHHLHRLLNYLDFS
jgi:hypothetical protein